MALGRSSVSKSDFFIEADFDGFIHVIDSQSGLIVGRSQIASGVKILDTLTVFKDKNVLGMTAEGEVLLIKFDQITLYSTKVIDTAGAFGVTPQAPPALAPL